MPKMQVTFTNVVFGGQQLQPADARHISLMFQIDFRGKSYNCVGHLRQFSAESIHESRVQFTGYYGYNGPIDIESLSSAVLGYYESTISTHSTQGKTLQCVKIDFDDPGASSDEIPRLSAKLSNHEFCLSYEFNVGKFHNRKWKEAS